MKISEEDKKIWESSIERAIEYLDENPWEEKHNSRTGDLLFNGKLYPTKPILKFAYNAIETEYPHIHIPTLPGGEQIFNFLENLGFEIKRKNNSIDDKLQPFIEKYKTLITQSNNYSEIYKWESLTNFKKHWNLLAVDLPEMFEAAFPGNNNLWSSNNYYPIAMLKGFSDTNPTGVVEAVTSLLDENTSIEKRIEDYKKAMDLLLQEDNVKRGLSSRMNYQDGRTIGLLLAFTQPDEYYLFKYNILKSFCEKFGLTAPKKGDTVNQIIINQDICNLVRSILIEDKELVKLHNERLTDMSYKEDDYHLLTQDFIYSTVTYLKDDMKYYVGGAYWDSQTPQDQTDRFLTNSRWENGYDDKFNAIVNNIPEGSTFAIKTVDRKGNKMHIKAIGTVVSNYKDGQCLEVEWKENFKPFVVDFSGGYWDTVKEVTNPDHINEIFFHTNMTEIMDMKKSLDAQPLNQILYGPPGTGKTYKTINKAIAIVYPDFDLNQDRDLIKAEYDRLVEAGQIVFTTFHQSMSYEDFIEGIKPETVDNNVIYDVQDGIFKEVCNAAKTINSVQNFDEVYEQFIAKIQESQTDYLELKTITGKPFWLGVNSKGSVDLYTTVNKNHQGVLTKSKLRAYANGLNTFTGWDGYATAIITYLKMEFKLNSDIGSTLENYVIIIDEINRGNVSQIFGELITLIEEDKRLGKKEALEVTLPYSKEKFGVPSNLHIIGTMNTADRSVEALDTALRRRFSFTEMMPEYDELYKIQFGSFNLGTVLKKINDRIETLLDRDHTIGHSYFINMKSGDTEALKETFFNKIIPLLQEYFYHDYEKMGWVLGQEFIDEVKDNKNDIFGSFYNVQQPDVETTYKLKDFKTLDILKAVEGLLGIKKDVSVLN